MRIEFGLPGLAYSKLLRVSIILLMCCASAFGANTNQVRVGILRFVNLSGQTNFNAWRESFPGKLQFDLQNARPARLDVYYTKVLKQLTSPAQRQVQAGAQKPNSYQFVLVQLAYPTLAGWVVIATPSVFCTGVLVYFVVLTAPARVQQHELAALATSSVAAGVYVLVCAALWFARPKLWVPADNTSFYEQE
jgi:hypothetical protein